MPRLLHILTRPADDLSTHCIECQRQDPSNEVVVVDLTCGEPNYAELVRQVFESDSIATW